MTKRKFLKVDLFYLFVPIIILMILLSFFFQNQPKLQFQLSVGASLLYVGMALLHHHFDKSLTLEIIIEYILIALLVLIISLGVFV